MTSNSPQKPESLNVTSPLRTRLLVRLVSVNAAALIVSVIITVTSFHYVGVTFSRIQAEHLMDAMLAVREYTSRKINPIVAPMNSVSNDIFLPEAVPSYSSTKVFEYLRLRDGYEQYSYREAALNPTNPADMASDSEKRIINDFIKDQDLKRKAGFLKQGGVDNIFYVAQPIKVSKESCLTCHSVPSRAPRSQIETYGTSGGYGWNLGDTVGAQVVTIKLSNNPLGIAWQSNISLLMQFLLSVTAIVSGYFIVKRLIIAPLSRLGAFAENAIHYSGSHSGSRISPGSARSDEIGLIARSIDYLRKSVNSKHY